MENLIIEEMKTICSFFSGKQREYQEKLISSAKSVKCVPLNTMFTEEQISIFRKIVKPNECFKNSILIANMLPEAVYVEGKVLVSGISLDHAFLKVGDKYVDPTLELVLNSDVTKETYVSIAEADSDEVTKIFLKYGFCCSIIPHYIK